MHDPLTVAFEIKYPWRQAPSKLWPKGYRASFITIWHKDPERHGDDDSCGFCVPHLTKRQRDRLKNWAWGEGQSPYFLKRGGKEWKGTRHEAEAMYRGLLLWVARIIEIPLTYDEAASEAARVIHNHDCIDAASRFCFQPGYHTNSDKDSAEDRQEHFHAIICGIARWLLRDRRPWYRHPRWHFWHWQFQIHPLLAFKRWAFSRCSKCGRGFKWGESPCTNSWHGTGPLWFRSERDTFHSNCMNNSCETKSATPIIK